MTGFRNAVFRGFKTDIDKVIVFADAEGIKLTAGPTDIDDISDVYVGWASTCFWSSDRNFIDKVIYNFPEIKVIAFFEDWETYDVYACLSSSGNSYVDTEMRVGLIDSNSDPTYSEEQFPTESFSLTAKMHNSDYTERVRYNFPYKNRWNDLDYAHIEDNKLYRISSIDIAEGTETIDRYDFSYNVHLKRLSLPSTLKTLSGNVLAKKSDIEIVIHPDNPYLNFDGQFLTEKQKGEVLFISENADLAALANPSINAIASFGTQNTGNEIVSEGTEDPQAPISLYELKFVVTGDLKSYPDRADFKAYIESRGGKLISVVSSKTDYLITNTPNSGTVKNVKARSLGIPVITEDEFFEKFGK